MAKLPSHPDEPRETRPGVSEAGSVLRACLVPPAPRISVVMPCFNARATIEETLRSIFEQDLPPYEVIVQDGGSRDGTLDILERHSRRLSYASAPDGGPAPRPQQGYRAR